MHPVHSYLCCACKVAPVLKCKVIYVMHIFIMLFDFYFTEAEVLWNLA